MEITNQLNHNECGVCVINTLVKYYFKKDIKEELLKEANITDNGMSLYDFETLCDKHGILTETFKLEGEEFINFEYKSFFIALMNNELGLHYILVKKHKHRVEVWDSLKGHYFLLVSDFLKNFYGVIITVTRSQKNICFENNKIKLFTHVDFKYLSINLFLQLCIISLSVLSANYISLLITNSFSNGNYANALSLSATFLFIFLSLSLSKYLSNLLTIKQVKSNYLQLSNIFFKNINNKDHTFFNKVNPNFIYIIDHAIQAVSFYNTVELSNFIASVIFSFVLLICITVINPMFILILLVAMVVLLTIGFIEFRFNNKILSKALSNGTNNSSLSSNMVKYINGKHNALVLNQITHDLKSNYHEYIHLFSYSTKFTSMVEMVLEISEKIIMIAMLIICAYYFDTEFKNDVSKIILAISLIGMFWGNINTTVRFITKYVEYQKMLEIFNSVTKIGNKPEGTEEIKKVQSISINSVPIRRNNSITYFNFDKWLTKYNEHEKNNVEINGINIKNIKNEWIYDNIYVIENNQKLNSKVLLGNIFSNHVLVEFIKQTKFDLTNLCDDDFQTSQLINVLSCLLIKNKIIVFKNNFKFINKKYQPYIYRMILPYIKKNNFVIFIKEKNIKS